MTERERWVIYPLLFFLFLMAIQDRVFAPFEAEFQDVVCKRLVIESNSGRKVVEAGSLMDSGVLIVYGTDESVNAKAAGIDSRPASRVLQMGGEAGGGYLTLYGPTLAPSLKLGHHEPWRISGLLAIEGVGEPRSADSLGHGEFWGPTIDWKSPASIVTDDAAEVESATGL